MREKRFRKMKTAVESSFSPGATLQNRNFPGGRNLPIARAACGETRILREFEGNSFPVGSAAGTNLQSRELGSRRTSAAPYLLVLENPIGISLLAAPKVNSAVLEALPQSSLKVRFVALPRNCPTALQNQ
jgi:hypothetical protein